MSKVVGVIQARMGSSRLPGKTLMDVAGKPMLQHVVERLSRAARIDEVVVATSTHAQDQVILDFAEGMGVRAVAGSEGDVLARYVMAAVESSADLVVRVTADCPLVDPVLSDLVIERYIQEHADYAANCIRQTYPRGVETEVFSAAKLAAIDRLTSKKYEREHVTPYFYEHPESFNLVFLEAQGELHRPDLRLCVDTPEDMTLIRTLFERLGADSNAFSMLDVVRLMTREPELRAINERVHQKHLGE